MKLICFHCFTKHNTFYCSFEMATVDDLATLTELNEDGILTELQERYKKDIIYVSFFSFGLSDGSRWVWNLFEQVFSAPCSVFHHLN